MGQPDGGRRIVVIGAVAAGTAAAAKARRNDENAEIVLYDRDEHISYSGCGLPYFIGGEIPEFTSLIPRDAAFFKEKYNVTVHTEHEVVSVDAVARTLRVRNLVDGKEFQDRYDILVLATGALPVRPGHSGSGSAACLRAAQSFGCTSHPNLTWTRSVRSHAVVVGSGFVGLEMTEALTRAGMAVCLVEKLPDLCPAVDSDMAPYIEDELDRNGVSVRTGCTVVSIEADRVVLDDGETVPAGLVLLAVGVRPQTALARAMDLEIGPTGAIAVNASMQTSRPEVYACGDCAENRSVLDGRVLYRPLGSTAGKTGRIAGDAMTGGDLRHRGIAGTGIFRVFGLTVASTGLKEEEARTGGRAVTLSHNIKPARPAYFGGQEMVIKAMADETDGTLLGVQIIGPEGVDKRMDVFVTAMTAGLKAQDLFHLDLAYAPPYATTRDPVHYTGMILDNAIRKNRRLLTPDQLSTMEPGSYRVIDTRVPEQYEKGHVPGADSLPHAEVRRVLANEDDSVKDRIIVTYCNKGTTGNAVQNILINRGYRKVYTLSGGYRQFEACRRRARQPRKERRP